jgi:hypothetical protein
VGRACCTHREEQECIQGFGRKATRKTPLGRPRRRREDIGVTEWGGMDWTDLVQGRHQ